MRIFSMRRSNSHKNTQKYPNKRKRRGRFTLALDHRHGGVRHRQRDRFVHSTEQNEIKRDEMRRHSISLRWTPYSGKDQAGRQVTGGNLHTHGLPKPSSIDGMSLWRPFLLLEAGGGEGMAAQTGSTARFSQVLCFHG
nr:hypothetical protein CFP56_32146 [Quercus suber]